jgi:hypothetical protein
MNAPSRCASGRATSFGRMAFPIVMVAIFLNACERTPPTYMMLCESDEECRRDEMICEEVAGSPRCTLECVEDVECPADCADHGECRDGLCVNIECV